MPQKEQTGPSWWDVVPIETPTLLITCAPVAVVFAVWPLHLFTKP